MSVSTEVQRTLVKSPPELWSELSNPEALARHLAELGEIRITSVEPETKVEWEAEGATGIVHLKQSGWGTKVTLSVTRVPPTSDEAPEPTEDVEPEPEPTVAIEPEPVASEPEPVAGEPEPVAGEPEPVAGEPEPVAGEPEPVAGEPEPVAGEPEPVAGEPEPEPESVAQSESVAQQPIPRKGFFARLFRRRKPGPVEIVEPQPEPEPDFEALAVPELIYKPTPQPAVDLGAELVAVEAQMEQETTELLTGVLDRLGAAHHRPFSRG